MADRLDIQNPIFSTYERVNKFLYWFEVKGRSVTVTPGIKADLKKIVKNALIHFVKYDKLWLKCELLGHHLENLYTTLYLLNTTPLGGKICSYTIRRKNPGKEPPSVGRPGYVDRWYDQIIINIENKIRFDFKCFPRLNFLEHASDDHFKQITKTLKLVGEDIDDFKWGISVGRYLKQNAFLRRGRENVDEKSS